MKIIFSGIQPSGELHLGNYLGAIKNWLKLQKNHYCFFCVVDYHALTVKQEPEVLKRRIKEVAKIYLTAGISPKNSLIFQQSRVKAHTELTWILNCLAKVSELKRMTQFKEKAKKHKENVNMGLFDYPVLMASDILLYNTDLVPVGDDQVQHVELARTLARRFNKEYSPVFKIPQVEIQEIGARIMGLDDPTKKMAKTADSETNYIGLLEKPQNAIDKIKRAVTDSGREIIYDKEKKPAISNLLTIYSLLSGKEIKRLEQEYKGKGYFEFKKNLGELIAKFLIDFQKKFYSLDDEFVEKIMNKGAKEAEKIADKTLEKVKKAIGIIT